MKTPSARAALWAAFLYLIAALVAAMIAPAAPRAAEAPHALVVLLSRPDDPKAETWQLVTDLAAPVDSESGPTSSANCATQAAMRLPLWLRDRMPGWEVEEWRCLPAAEVERFLKSHRGADI